MGQFTSTFYIDSSYLVSILYFVHQIHYNITLKCLSKQFVWFWRRCEQNKLFSKSFIPLEVAKQTVEYGYCHVPFVNLCKYSSLSETSFSKMAKCLIGYTNFQRNLSFRNLHLKTKVELEVATVIGLLIISCLNCTLQASFHRNVMHVKMLNKSDFNETAATTTTTENTRKIRVNMISKMHGTKFRPNPCRMPMFCWFENLKFRVCGNILIRVVWVCLCVDRCGFIEIGFGWIQISTKSFRRLKTFW